MTNNLAEKMTEEFIHPTAIVSPKAQLGKNVEIGPYCTVGDDVVLGDNVVLKSHVIVDGHTTIGENTIVHPFATIGLPPQSRGYNGEPTRVEIGKNCQIREYATIHKGTVEGGGVTKVGDNCFIMVGAHIAHDCDVGSRVGMANHATLGGKVVVEDNANIGGLSAIHQNVRIGKGAMVGGFTGINADIPPFSLIMAHLPAVDGLNLIGLRRGGQSRDDIKELKDTFERAFVDKDATLAERLEDMKHQYPDNELVQHFVEFLTSEHSRGVTPYGNRKNAE